MRPVTSPTCPTMPARKRTTATATRRGSRLAPLMSAPSLQDLLNAALDVRRARFQFRQRQIVRPIDAVHVEIDGRRYVNFCSNNYLGLTHHPRVIEAIERAAETHGGGAAASPLISGYSDLHAAAEQAL